MWLQNTCTLGSDTEMSYPLICFAHSNIMLITQNNGVQCRDIVWEEGSKSCTSNLRSKKYSLER